MTNILNIFKKNLKSIITLVCICAVVAVLMAFTNALTYDKIQKNADLKASAALSEVMPGGAPFTLMQNIDEYNLPESIIEVHKSSNGGFVFKLKAKGYQPGMIIMCGIDANGYITGAKYLEGAETNGAEITMSQRVPGATLETIGDVDTATSPTAPLTVNGYLSAIKDALNSAIVLSGGEADFRTEEEIFNDKCSVGDQRFRPSQGSFNKCVPAPCRTSYRSIFRTGIG